MKEIAARPPVLKTDRLLLRCPVVSDIEAILDYYERNRAHLAPFEPVKPSAFYTYSYWERQIRHFSREFDRGEAVRFFFFPRRNGKDIVGYASFSQIHRRVAQYCVLGYSVSHEYQGQGYMTEGLSEAIRYMFESQNLHRIMANYMPHNRRSGKLLRRLGFDVEGYARDYLFINGQWEDHLLTALINHDWKPG